MVRCALVPAALQPNTDLATPLTQDVEGRVASRLRQRKRRHQELLGTSEVLDTSSRLLVAFPWNMASRAKAAGKAFYRAPDPLGIPCKGCDATSRRWCTCGWEFGSSMAAPAMTSFHRFVRAPTTPVYNESEPRDQSQFQTTIANIVPPGGDALAVSRVAVRFAGFAAISGCPAVMTKLENAFKREVSDDDLVAAIAALIDGGGAIFRGGQCHGPLKKSDMPAATRERCSTYVSILSEKVVVWANSTLPCRCEAVLAVKDYLETARSSFKGGKYWTKRFLEILLLAGLGKPADLDFLFGTWPVPNGTGRGILLIFPEAKSQKQQRAASRAIQRALGTGVRQVPLVRVSAFLCFWQRCLNGSLHWPVHRFA